MGWVLIILGVIQLTGGFSLLSGNTYGRVLGIIGGSLGAIGALLSIGGANPWWSLAIFFLCVWVVYGIVILGDDVQRAPATCSWSQSQPFPVRRSGRWCRPMAALAPRELSRGF